MWLCRVLSIHRIFRQYGSPVVWEFSLHLTLCVALQTLFEFELLKIDIAIISCWNFAVALLLLMVSIWKQHILHYKRPVVVYFFICLCYPEDIPFQCQFVVLFKFHFGHFLFSLGTNTHRVLVFDGHFKWHQIQKHFNSILSFNQHLTSLNHNDMPCDDCETVFNWLQTS